MEPKERILLKARELFLQYGIRSVSMDDIANHLGISKKTLYQYFIDKDELVSEVVKAHINEIQDDCLVCRTGAKDAIHEMFTTLEKIQGKLHKLNPMLVHDLEKFHFKAFQQLQGHKEKFLLQSLRENLEWGIREELYRPDLNIDVLSKFRIESMMIPFNVAAFPPGKYNLVSLAEILFEHFLYGIATPRGYKLIQKYNEQRQKNQQHEEVGK